MRRELPTRASIAWYPSGSIAGVALYVSNGLIFELYEGGRPWRKHVIQWERLRTIDDAEETK